MRRPVDQRWKKNSLSTDWWTRVVSDLLMLSFYLVFFWSPTLQKRFYITPKSRIWAQDGNIRRNQRLGSQCASDCLRLGLPTSLFLHLVQPNIHTLISFVGPVWVRNMSKNLNNNFYYVNIIIYQILSLNSESSSSFSPTIIGYKRLEDLLFILITV